MFLCIVVGSALVQCILRLHCSLILEGSCPCPPVSQCLTPQRGNQDDPRLPLRFTCSSPPYFFFSRHLTKKWFFDKARKDSDKTLPKTQWIQSIACFESINTFFQSRGSYNLWNLGQASAWFCLAMGKKWEWQSDLQGKAMIGLGSDTNTYAISYSSAKDCPNPSEGSSSWHTSTLNGILTIPPPSSLCKAATY